MRYIILSVRRNNVQIWKQILIAFIAGVLLLCSGAIAGYLSAGRSYAELQQRTESQLGQLRGALTDAQVRSDTAIRGLDESIKGLGAIQDRNRRITVLIDTIGATVSQLRAIYERSSATLQTVGAAEKPVEVPSNRN
jgi:hypothetical protein